MNTFQSTISSPRNQRIMFWLGLVVLAAGIVTLIVKFAGGSGKESAAPDPGFKAQLPAKTQPLKNADGVVVKNYFQLDPDIKGTVRGFITNAVLTERFGASWKYIAPSLRRGYTFKQWATANAHPIVPLPGYELKTASYQLFEATTKEILVDVRLNPKPGVDRRPVRMRIGMVPNRTEGGQRWLVDYWMPLWTPLLPIN